MAVGGQDGQNADVMKGNQIQEDPAIMHEEQFRPDRLTSIGRS
jgi:hypothetical protein